jgi:hypothetical protein
VKLFCGCFRGTPDELRSFIADNEPRYARTRTVALDAVLLLLDTSNEVAP